MATKLESRDRPLSPRERLFIDRFIQLGACKGRGKQAAEAAGYPPSWSKVAASRMLRIPRIARAVEEESRRLLRALGPRAIQVIAEILDDPEHKDRLKAARTVLERIDPTVFGVQHQHRVDVTVEGMEMSLRMLQAMRELRVPREIQRERLGPNIFEQLEAALDGMELNGNGKILESGPLLIEGAVLEAESDDGEDE
jgi:phage terminase small subunit